MPEELLPEQKEQLTNWSVQRDALLGEIAQLVDQKQKLSQQTAEIAISYSEIANKIQQSIGRMEELDKQEKLYMEIVASELPGLEKEKSTLQSEVSGLKKEITVLNEKKENLHKEITLLITTQEDVFKRTGILEKVVEHVTNVSSSNIKELNSAVASIKEKTDEILKVSTENINAHTRILNEIPALFVELQRKSLTREKI